MLGAVGQGRPRQLDDPLVAVGVLALIDSKGDIALAEQARHRQLGRARLDRPCPGQHDVQLCRIVLGIAAHSTIGRHIRHDHPDRPVALGLKGKDAVIFEGAGEQHGKGDRLSEHRRDRLGIGVLRQDAVDRRAEPHQAAAQRERIDLKRLDQIIRRGAVGGAQIGALRRG